MKKGESKWTPIAFREGADGVIDAKRFRTRCQKPKFVADCLARELAWRKGEGEYAFNEDPQKNADMPFCPKALSIVQEEAIRMLVEYNGVLLERRRACKTSD